MRTVPVKYSAGPLAEGEEPFRLICIRMCSAKYAEEAISKPAELDADPRQAHDTALSVGVRYDCVVSSPQLRRQDRMLVEVEARELIARAYCGRVATVGTDGCPYVVPLLHVFSGSVISMHNSAARGHFRLNIERDGRACFQVDEPVEVFDYGRFECDSGLA